MHHDQILRLELRIQRQYEYNLGKKVLWSIFNNSHNDRRGQCYPSYMLGIFCPHPATSVMRAYLFILVIYCLNINNIYRFDQDNSRLIDTRHF
jgi:hypothetical protein